MNFFFFKIKVCFSRKLAKRWKLAPGQIRFEPFLNTTHTHTLERKTKEYYRTVETEDWTNSWAVSEWWKPKKNDLNFIKVTYKRKKSKNVWPVEEEEGVVVVVEVYIYDRLINRLLVIKSKLNFFEFFFVEVSLSLSLSLPGSSMW